MTAETAIKIYRKKHPVLQDAPVFSYEECREMMIGYAKGKRREILKAARDNSKLLITNTREKTTEYLEAYQSGDDTITVSRTLITNCYPESLIN